jgi:iron complex transport system permease protein
MREAETVKVLATENIEEHQEKAANIRKTLVNSVFSPANKNRFWFIGLAVLLVALVLLSAGDGAVPISVVQITAILAKQIGFSLGFEFTVQQESVLLAIRLPRVLLGILVGAGLATAGAALQGLFRNPLAEPTLIGVSSGAALAAVAAIVLGERLAASIFASGRIFLLPVAAFVGGIVTTLLIYRLGKRGGRTDAVTVLLAGIAVNALCFAGIGFLMFIASDAQLRNISFWNLGSLASATWESLAVVAPFIFIPLVFLSRTAHRLNCLLLGEAEAAHLGVNVEQLKTTIVLLVALIVGAGVSVTGVISFVGLVVPHLLRLLMGADNRGLLPASALFGASLMIGADWLSRTAVAPAELPVGIITAALGAPFFLWLLVREKSKI